MYLKMDKKENEELNDLSEEPLIFSYYRKSILLIIIKNENYHYSYPGYLLHDSSYMEEDCHKTFSKDFLECILK